ncbi:ATP-binding cassette domain-containing protein [Echinimonas agarilytica]|uniref:ATP-binding cassette domain-containing protein n=1 Tax=Echinimonas agarilytica TaxID=1215918 RepID=A0AA41W659_9GAMM|nr:ATP-binding cassette domain-containing protein [Echinimonas agarilytica]MCM2679725.1 ATP-binding cassette domain-containing protein [Echinimonas agarilytica]
MYLSSVISLPNRHVRHSITVTDWNLSGYSWAVTGRNNSGKELLLELLAGHLDMQGSLTGMNGPVSVVSFAEQQRLVEREIKEDESDLIDEIDNGRSVLALMQEVTNEQNKCEGLAEKLGLSALIHHGFRSLSTGETRKLILARALLKRPNTLLLHDPYEGLDINATQYVDSLLQQLSRSGVQLIYVSDRPSDIPHWLEHIAVFETGKLALAADKQSVLASCLWQSLTTAHQSSPCPTPLEQFDTLAINEPIFEIRSGQVSYGNNQVFKDLNWRIEQGENWRVIGPNGSGKTTLLKLICGDHPQCYSNWIRQFGMQRGNGETIWDIKRRIGLVNAELQLNYRVKVNVITAVISGYFDSVGVYREISQCHKNHAKNWLDWFGIAELANQPFHGLSYGQQRLVLIIRALVKSPLLLILDEPLQGLDESNAQLVLTAINRIIEAQVSQLLYVSHRDEPGLHAHCQVLSLAP